MAKAIRHTDAGRLVDEVPELPPCPWWCDGGEESPCWGYDIDEAWTASNVKVLGPGVAIVQLGRWTPSSGLSMTSAECAVEGDMMLSADEVRLMIEALSHAVVLLDDINAGH
jgi:hypothetical protein